MANCKPKIIFVREAEYSTKSESEQFVQVALNFFKFNSSVPELQDFAGFNHNKSEEQQNILKY